MGNLGKLVILLAGVVCLGSVQVSKASELDELTARMNALETSQRTFQASLQNLEQIHTTDADNVTQLCQGLQVRVEKQEEALEAVQDSLDNDGNQQPDLLEGPCSPDVYKVLDDAWRSPDVILDHYDDSSEYSYDYSYDYDYYFNSQNPNCDRDLSVGWYRFFLHGENAVIPTQCVSDYRCLTHAPLWLDLEGQSLPEVGQEAQTRACAHWTRDCCLWHSSVTIRNCGDFFVYHLEHPGYCSLAWCAEPQ